jgi:hypothetical protein
MADIDNHQISNNFETSSTMRIDEFKVMKINSTGETMKTVDFLLRRAEIQSSSVPILQKGLGRQPWSTGQKAFRGTFF